MTKDIRIKEKTPQSFVVFAKDFIYGASFKKHPNTNIYFGKVSKYTKQQWKNPYQAKKLYERRWKNINLGRGSVEETKQKLINWILERIPNSSTNELIWG